LVVENPTMPIIGTLFDKKVVSFEISSFFTV